MFETGKIGKPNTGGGSVWRLAGVIVRALNRPTISPVVKGHGLAR